MSDLHFAPGVPVYRLSGRQAMGSSIACTANSLICPQRKRTAPVARVCLSVCVALSGWPAAAIGRFGGLLAGTLLGCLHGIGNSIGHRGRCLTT